MTQIADVLLATYEPDRARYALNASDGVLNAKPTADGWGPLPSLEVFTDALAAEPRGAFTGIAPDGTLAGFAGTVDTMYKLGAGGAWSDVSSGTYALPTGDAWQFDIFGSRVVMTNIADGPEYWDIGSSSAFATLPGSPPAAKYVRTVGDFLVLGNLSGTPNGVRWSGLGNSEQWTSGEELSDSQEFADGGSVQGILAVSGGAVVFQQYCIRSMIYTPESGYTFAFDYVNKNRGVIAPRSIVNIGPNDFVYLSSDGFFRGNEAIGAEKVDATFRRTCDPAEIANVEGSADPINKIVWFRYKTVSATYQFLAYDWQLGRFFPCDQDTRGMAVMASSAATLEDLDTLFPGGMDATPLNADSPALGGGTLAFGGFNSSYEFGYFTGVAQAATLETASQQLNKAGRAFVSGAEVIGDLGVVDGDGASTFTMQAGTADYHDMSETFGGAAEPNTRTGIVPFRSSARMHRFRVNIASGANWTHTSAIRAHFKPEGNA